MRATPVERVDHLVYATPDLDATVADIEVRLGVRATPGGQHPGRGTRNALIAIGPRAYLEIIGPDPHQPAPARPRWFGIDTLASPRLVSWAANTRDIRAVHAAAVHSGIGLGDVIEGERRCHDGVLLMWQCTDPGVVLADGVVPFFIDWGAGPHPASSAVRGPGLVGLRAEHPAAANATLMVQVLGIMLNIKEASQPSIIATFQTPTGAIELR